MTDIVGRQAPGTPVWIDHMAKDPQAARAFYTSLLPWEVSDSGEEFGNYAMAGVGERMAAGLGPADPAFPVGAVWTVYIEVDDVSAAVNRATELGGQVFVPPMPIPTVGEMAMVADPTGAMIGLWHSDPFTGFGGVEEVGFAGWHELLSSDPAKAREFYGSLFGWVFVPMEDEGTDYTTAHLGEGTPPVAGVGALPEGGPATGSFWQSYLQVADADAAVEQIRGGGGSVFGEPFDTPFGRMAFAADPQGAVFAVFSAPVEAQS